MAKLIDCWYGQSMTGKSEGAASLIEQVYENEGLLARVLIGDGSKATYIERGLVDAGVVQVCDYSIREWPLSTMQQLCDGWFPADPEDPKSPLLPPKPEVIAKLGVVVIEGLAVASQYLMGDMHGGLAEQAGRGIKIGQDSPVVGRDVEYDPKTGAPIAGTGTGLSFGGNAVAHYGFAQRRMLANLERSKRFPHYVIWTTHEMGAENKVTKEKLVGPEVAGQAMTANLPRHFNNTLHFATAAKKAKHKDGHTEAQVYELDVEYRIYTRDHFDADGQTMTKFKAGARGIAPSVNDGKDGLMPAYLTSDIPGKALLDFYAILAKQRAKRVEALKTKGKAA
jgi:hypothetical protein